MPHPPVVCRALGSGTGMAPWKSKRTAPSRPTGDLEGKEPIWNGAECATPSSSSNMRFPSGDVAIFDDISPCIEEEDKPLSVVVQSRRPRGVTQPQSEAQKRWEMAYGGNEHEFFAPLPHPDEDEDTSRGQHEADVGRQLNFSEFAEPTAEGGGVVGPSPTRTDQPGTELSGRSPTRHLVSPQHAHADDFPQESEMILPVPVGLATSDPERSSRHQEPSIPQQAELFSPPQRAKPKLRMKKSVSFNHLDPKAYEVTPYAEVYGDHPKTFNFDAEGNKVSHVSFPQWAGFAQQSFSRFSQGFGQRDWGFDQYEESEPLY